MADRFEEGTVTILFTDVERSTDLGAEAGDLSAREVMRALEEIIRAQITEHGGREIKSLGDGFMVGFPSARRAVSCAVGIQRALAAARRDEPDRYPPVRVGLNAGEVVHEADDVFGTAVAAAARITAHARGGQILASEVVKALVGTLPQIEFRDAGRFPLKGFDEEWSLLEIAWERESPGLRSSRKTPFVGRDRERSQLCELLDEVESGKGSLALIAGEPGVGKTRLAEEVAREAERRNYRVLVGRCYDVDSPAPYLPFVELLESAANTVDRATFRMALGDTAGEIAKVMPQLRNIFDDVPPGLELPSEQDRRYLFNSIVEFVDRAASVKPLMVVLDDLHWADQPSLALLEQVARRLKDMPVLIVGTYRNMDLDLNRPLAHTLDELLRARLADRITLKRLSEKGVEAMLTRLAGTPPPVELVDIIFKETDGNAFFVEELFRHLCEENQLLDENGEWRADLQLGRIEVPEGVRLVIGRRLEQLDEDALKIMTVASVVGRTFDYELLVATSGEGEDTLLDAIEAAQRLTLVEPLDSAPMEARYEFVHELTRQTLLGGISLPRRQRMHLRVAAAMESLYKDSLAERAAEILNHLYQAGAATSDQAICLLQLAGQRALESAAFEDALRYFEESLALVDDSDRSTKARGFVGLGHAQRSLGRVDDAVLNYSEALTIFDELGDQESLGEVGQEMVLQLAWGGDWEQLVQIAGRVLDVLGQEPTRERTLLLAFGAIGLSWAGFHDPARDMIDEALAIAKALDDDEILGQIYTVASTHEYAYGRLHKSIEIGTKAVELLEGSAAQWNYLSALAFVMLAKAFTGQLDDLPEMIRKVERMSERLGFGGGVMFANRAQFVLAVKDEVRVDEYERLARKDVEICNEYELPWIPQAHIFLSRALFQKGDIEGALKHATIGFEDEPPSALYGFGLGTFFVFKCYAGDREKAMDVWPRLEAILPEPDAPNTFGRLCSLDYAIEGFYMLGDDERAASFYDLVESTDTGIPWRFATHAVQTIAGIAAAAAQKWDAAERHFENAMALAVRNHLALEQIEIRRFYGDMLLRKGETERGRGMLEEALEGYVRAGMPFHAQLARKLLGRVEASAEPLSP